MNNCQNGDDQDLVYYIEAKVKKFGTKWLIHGKEIKIISQLNQSPDVTCWIATFKKSQLFGLQESWNTLSHNKKQFVITKPTYALDRYTAQPIYTSQKRRFENKKFMWDKSKGFLQIRESKIRI